MYFDSKPCQQCGAEVELRARESLRATEADADATVDERVCTNPECPSHSEDGPGREAGR